jgi:hypothetical protein
MKIKIFQVGEIYCKLSITRQKPPSNGPASYWQPFQHIAYCDGILTGTPNGTMITGTGHSVTIKSYF